MGDKHFKKTVILSFSKVKEDIFGLENKIEALKTVILRQNELIRLITERLTPSSETSQNDQNTPFFNSSTGNKGVNQSINQSINQSLKYQAHHLKKPLLKKKF